MIRSAPLLLLALAGCPPAEEVLDPIGTWEEPGSPVGFLAYDETAAAPARVVVRAVNDWQVAVPADSVEIVLDGAPNVVDFDDAGFGVLEVSDPGVHAASASGTVVEIVVLEQPTPLVAQPSAAARDELIEVLPASNGAIGRSATSLWWIPAGGRALEILHVPDGRTLDGFRVGHLDHDGVSDAIAWSGDTVLVLRGHPFGGHSLVGSIVAADRLVGGATLDDADGDDEVDIVIGWTSSSRHELEVWLGDGAWGFDNREPIKLRRAPHALGIGDNNGEKRPQITILDDSDFWIRYVASGESWSATGPQIEDFFFVPGSEPWSADFNGDDAEELFIVAPYVAGAEREVALMDLSGESIQFTRIPLDGAHIAIADSDADGRADLWYLDSAAALFQRKNPGDGQAQRRVWSPPEFGPIAVTEITGDAVNDLLVAGPDHWAWTYGGVGTFDGATWWTPGEGELSFDLGLTQPGIPVELDGESTTTEIVGVYMDGSQPVLGSWTLFTGENPAIAPIGSLTLGSGVNVLDLAACGDFAYVLTDTELARFDLSGSNPVRAGRTNTSGTLVACGDGPGDAVVAVLDTANVRLFDAALSPTTTQPSSNVDDIALGGDALHTCETPGCSVVAWDYGDDVLSVTGTAGGLAFDDGGSFVSGGDLITQDIDGDGLLDLLAHDRGTVVVVRSAGDGYGVDQLVSTALELEGEVWTIDRLNNGQRTLAGTREGAIVISTGAPESIPASE